MCSVRQVHKQSVSDEGDDGQKSEGSGGCQEDVRRQESHKHRPHLTPFPLHISFVPPLGPALT